MAHFAESDAVDGGVFLFLYLEASLIKPMLPFFRKIRWRLAQDNQFFKYSRYAIGEIVLVVLGILIALSVNNWNEDRKKTNTEVEYLIRLRSDLANDTAYFHRRIKYSEKVIADHKKAVKISLSKGKTSSYY